MMAPLFLLEHNHKTIFYCTIVHYQTQKVRAEKSSSLLVIAEQMVAAMAILSIKSLVPVVLDLASLHYNCIGGAAYFSRHRVLAAGAAQGGQGAATSQHRNGVGRGRHDAA
jgi:hypothetical protein